MSVNELMLLEKLRVVNVSLTFDLRDCIKHIKSVLTPAF